MHCGTVCWPDMCIACTAVAVLQISANLRKALGGNAKDVVDVTGEPT